MKEKRTLIIDIENKKLIDSETGEILAERGSDINRVLRELDQAEIPYTMQIWF